LKNLLRKNNKMKFEKQLKNISWNKLERLVGPQILQRGENYFKKGKVRNLAVCSEGLIANVIGSDDYITLVSFEENRDNPELQFQCTCPYGSGCKHSIAVVLAYIDSIKKGKHVPEVSSSDNRLKQIKEGRRRDDLEEDFMNEMSVKTNPVKDISEYLAKYSKEALIEMIIKLSASHPNLQEELMDLSRLSSGKTTEIASSIRKEISSIMSEPAWHSHWSDEGNLADFSRVEKNLLNLCNKGDYDIVVELTKFLFERAYTYIEQCNDDGNSACQITECLNIGFRALKNSTLPDFEKLLFAISSQLEDDYDLCQEASEVIDSIHDKNVWSKIADHFYKQLKTIPTQENEDGFIRNYQRDKISNILAHALSQSERTDEILPIYENEAKITGSWERLVFFLIENNQPEKARAAAEEGIKIIGKNWPGITNSLRTTIANLAAKQGDFYGILLLKQEDFLDRPGLSSFEALLEAAIKTNNVEEMKSWALHYLETGKAPAKGALNKAYQPEDKFHHREFPQYQVLIDIAEKEKRVDDVWSLYQAATNKKKYFNSHAQVAQIIKDKYPEESLKIYQKLAEDLIAETNSSAYTSAVDYLKKVQKIYIKAKRTKEWTQYLEHLKNENKRKPRFIKELRRLSDEKLL